MQQANPSNTLPHMEGSENWTFAMVEERLVEALIVARRVPDREAGWLHVKAAWPDVLRATWLGDYGGEGVDGASAARVRPVPLSREQLRRADEAERWLGRYLDDERERALVVLALSWLAAGRRVGWTRIGRLTGERVRPETLARRYLVAVARIVAGLNGKGQAEVQRIVRRRLAGEARERAGSGAASAAPLRGRRRRVEVEVVYSD